MFCYECGRNVVRKEEVIDWVGNVGYVMHKECKEAKYAVGTNQTV